jgi:hypothetical protein
VALLELNPGLDWGAPGAVVHAVERFCGQGYEPVLLASVRRAPTAHTVWMLNRLINGAASPGERDGYLAVMREVAARDDVPDEVRQSALEFLEFQGSNS